MTKICVVGKLEGLCIWEDMYGCNFCSKYKSVCETCGRIITNTNFLIKEEDKFVEFCQRDCFETHLRNRTEKIQKN